MKPNIKKLLILNAPYLLFVYLFDKVGQAVRLSPGADLSGKLLSIGSGFSAAFSNALPSFIPADLLIGIIGAVIIRLAVYLKGKNAKKYRKGMEYGSARCRAYSSRYIFWFCMLLDSPACSSSLESLSYKAVILIGSFFVMVFNLPSMDNQLLFVVCNAPFFYLLIV